MSIIAASAMAGFSERTGHKWIQRFRREGTGGLQDRSSQPHRLARSHELGLVVEAVGRRRRGQAAVRIARELGVPRSTVGFWLRKAGTSLAASLIQKEPDNRYEHDAPGLAELNLTVRPLRVTLQPELHRLLKAQGWKPGTWALLNRKGQPLAQGQVTADGSKALLDAAASAGLQAPIRKLEAFLLKYPDHTQAFQALVLAHLQAATAKMEKYLAPLDSASKDRVLLKALTTEEDARIWGPCARLLGRMYREGLDEMGATSIFFALPAVGRYSALMGQLAQEALPILEARLLQVPGEFIAWEAWVRLNGMAPRKRSIRALIEQMPPLPGRAPYLPSTTAIAFGEEARAQKDWQGIVDVLGPVWILALEIPPRIDPEGSEAGKARLDYEWPQASALLEARMRLDQDQEAETVATQLINHTGQRGAAVRAAALATSCGKPALARRLAALEPVKDAANKTVRMGR